MQNREKNNKTNLLGITSAFRIEIDKTARGISACIHGVLSVPRFSEETVIIRVRGRRIKIRGKMLSLAVYENRIAEIVGDIEGIEFL